MKKKELKVGKNDFLLKDKIGGILMSLVLVVGAIVIFVCLFTDAIDKTEFKWWFLAAFILFIGVAFLYSQIKTIKTIKKGDYVIYQLPVKEKKTVKVPSRNLRVERGPNLCRYNTHYILLFDVEKKEENVLVAGKVYRNANVGSMFYVVVVEGCHPVCYSMDTYCLSSKDQQHLRG